MSSTVAPRRSEQTYDSSQRQPRVVEELFALVQFRDLLVQLVGRNIKTRYKRTVLGIAWTMLNPLLMMTVMAIVFSSLFQTSIQFYSVFVLIGLVVWSFFSQTTTSIMNELIWGGSLIHRIYVPKTVFAASALGTGLVNFGLALVPLFLIMIIAGAPLHPTLLLLPLPILFLALFTMGFGLMLSIWAVRFGDVVDMYQIILTAWMYLTPIIYPAEIIPENVRWVLAFNPLFYMVTLFRALILDGVVPGPLEWLVSFLLGITFFGLGLWFFARNADEIAYRV